MKTLGFLWSLPLTLLGLLAAWLGRCRYLGTTDGVIEFYAKQGGLAAWVFLRTGTVGASGIWGCVCIYADLDPGPRTRAHERRHSAQAMVLGVLWPVVYLLGGVYALITEPFKKSPFPWSPSAFYWFNPLEIDARRAAWNVPAVAVKTFPQSPGVA